MNGAVMRIENDITVTHLENMNRRIYQTSSAATDAAKRDCALNNIKSISIVIDVEEMRPDLLLIEVENSLFWGSADEIILTQLILGLGWDGGEVTVHDLSSGEAESTLRGIGHVKTVNGHNKFSLTAVAA